MASDKVEKVIIIGSGPAGHTAAIYAARAELYPLMFEGFMAAGVAAGGQLTTTTEVENYPGFPEGISGPVLMDRMREQSQRLGTRIETRTVESVDLKSSPKKVIVGTGDSAEEFLTETVIIATGATAKRLGIKGEEELWQKGISACAVCDGALPMYRDQPLVVIGGGDTACEEASYLSKFGSSVHMLVRRDVFRASKAMQDRVFNNPKIEIHWNTNAIEALQGEANKFGMRFLGGVKVKNNKSGEVYDIPAKGLFYAVGHTPNTAFLQRQLKTDETGYLVAKPDSTATELPGVFACGDVKDKVYRQAVTAAGSGCMAALEAERYLTEKEST
ncbi:thioredoxin-disulfide reductase [Marispirochaeta aestuarii]|uniref:thioredoxin-disulfide reductase n=1 Tax=Marispirochaeta aestuarii TaxID=1963862 RepID=UPI002ABD329E|nr:thioredoxin-disulfide reductase [Marispirochaeta aestuarii]